VVSQSTGVPPGDKDVLHKDLPAVTHAIPAVRWLVLAVLIVLAAYFPSAGSPAPYIVLYGSAVLYSLALALYAASNPVHAVSAARWGLWLDALFLIAGAHFTGFPVAFVLLGFPLAAVAGVLTDHGSGTVIAMALALSQFPLLPGSLLVLPWSVQVQAVPGSILAPERWISWALLTIGLAATANVGAEAMTRLSEHARLSRTLATIKAITAAGGASEDVLQGILNAAVRHFRAVSGSFMLLDPTTNRLEVLAAHGLSDAHRQAWSHVGEGIAGWVAQGGRAVLLTPGASFPVLLERQGIASSICIPVVVNRETAGVLNLNRSTGTSQFSVLHLEAAELVAQAAGGVLARAQHERTFVATLHALAGGHARVSYALTRDPAIIWPTLLDLVRSLTPATFALLATEREDTGNIEVVSVRGIGGAAARGLLPELIAATTRNEVRTTQTAGTANSPVTCVPLTIGERTIGALGLGVSADGRWDRSMLTAIGAHVAVAVDTAITAHRIADIGAVEERRRIAREIHDGLAQTLATALLQTDLAAITAQTDASQIGTELKETRSLLERGMRELREFMAELRRPAPVEQGLFDALGSLAREFQRRHELDVALVSNGDDSTLPPAVRQAVMAIARQAMVNVDSHAHATTVAINAEASDSRCAVRIADNGVGFDLKTYQATPQTGYHLGLTSMMERAALVGGVLKIESSPNRGTTIVLDVPFGGSDA